MRKQPDALFVFRRQTTGQRALGVLAHCATYIGLTLCSPVLWLLMKLMPLLVVAAMIGELAMAYTYFAVRRQVFGGIMSLVMVLVVFFAAGALIRFRTWLIIQKERARW
jgi:hypothetical protein